MNLQELKGQYPKSYKKLSEKIAKDLDHPMMDILKKSPAMEGLKLPDTDTFISLGLNYRALVDFFDDNKVIGCIQFYYKDNTWGYVIDDINTEEWIDIEITNFKNRKEAEDACMLEMFNQLEQSL